MCPQRKLKRFVIMMFHEYSITPFFDSSKISSSLCSSIFFAKDDAEVNDFDDDDDDEDRRPEL